MTADPGMPRKVLRLAWEYGLHNDCLASQRPCTACEDSARRAFEHFYGHLVNEKELVLAIFQDFQEDALNE